MNNWRSVFKKMRSDDGMTLSEVMVAILLFTILTTISMTFLVNGSQLSRALTMRDTREYNLTQFEQQTTQAFTTFQGFRKIGGTSAANFSVLFDFKAPDGACAVFEITQWPAGAVYQGGPVSPLPFMWWRRGYYVTAPGGSTNTCVKTTPAATNIKWLKTRFETNPVSLAFVDSVGFYISSFMPTDYGNPDVVPASPSTAVWADGTDWDLPIYDTITRIEMSRLGAYGSENTAATSTHTSITLPKDITVLP